MTSRRILFASLCLSICLSSSHGARKVHERKSVDGLSDRRRRDRRRRRRRDESAPPSACPAGRRSVLVEELDRQNSGISSQNRALKYQKIKTSAFLFYRGSTHLFYKDVSEQGWLEGNEFDDSTGGKKSLVWISGDTHMENFGSIQNTDGDVVEVINDYDESYVASYLYDIWRSAVSMVIVARANGEGSDTDLEEIVGDSFVEQYLDTVERVQQDAGELEEMVSTKTARTELQEFLEEVKDKESRGRMLSKWTSRGQFLIPHPKDKLGSPSRTERSRVSTAIASYSLAQPTLQGDGAYFAVKDVARRLLAGTGSLGKPRFYVLIEGPTSSKDDDVILDVKQQSYPAIHEYANSMDKERMAIFSASEQGQRVAVAQLASNYRVDTTLGHTEIDGKPFLVRQRNPYKDTFDSDKLTSKTKLKDFVGQLGKILARAHSRSDKTFSNPKNPITWDFPSKIVDLTRGRHSEFGAQVLQRAVAYADQVAVDHACFIELLSAGDLN